MKYVKSFHYLPKECQSSYQKSYQIHVEENTSYLFEHAYPDSLYTFQIQAINGDEISESSSTIECRTASKGSGKVRNLRVEYEENEIGNVSMPAILWDYPCDPNGDLELFSIFINNLDINKPEYYDVTAEYRSNFTYRISSLKIDSSDFVIKIRGESRSANGDENSIILCSSSGCAIPDLKNESKILENINQTATQTSIELTIPNSIFDKSHSEDIKEISILIAQIDCENNIKPKKGLRRNYETFLTWMDVKNFDCVPQYRTTVISSKILENQSDDDEYFNVIIGDETTCVYFFSNCNGPLKPGTWYGIIFRLTTSRGFADTNYIAVRTFDDQNFLFTRIGLLFTIASASAVFGIIVILVIIIISSRR